MTSAEQPRSLGEIWRARDGMQVSVARAPHTRGHDRQKHVVSGTLVCGRELQSLLCLSYPLA